MHYKSIIINYFTQFCIQWFSLYIVCQGSSKFSLLFMYFNPHPPGFSQRKNENLLKHCGHLWHYDKQTPPGLSEVHLLSGLRCPGPRWEGWTCPRWRGQGRGGGSEEGPLPCSGAAPGEMMVPRGVSLLAQGTDGGQRLKGASPPPQGSRGMAQWAGSTLEGNVYSKGLEIHWPIGRTRSLFSLSLSSSGKDRK